MRRRTRKKVNPDATCYMCEKPALNREHAPPLAFFPRDVQLRQNLITVPSCLTHNNDNSHDVKYVRNIIVTDINCNEVGQRMFAERALPSYRENRKLTSQTFAKVREVRIGGRETAIIRTNRTRFNRIMRGAASALYFNDYGQKFPFRWQVHPATMLSENVAFLDLPDPYTPRINELLRSVPVADRDTNQPEVFKYGVYRSEHHRVIYRLVFYGGVDIYVYGLGPDEEIVSDYHG
jgi:hypothetical protein